MPTKTLLQQFKELKTAFLSEYTYENTGPHDDSDIVVRFFMNAYTLRSLAGQTKDTVACIKIDEAMPHYEMQFGMMLGGSDMLETIKSSADNIAKVMLGARKAVHNQHIIVNEMTFFGN